MPQLVTGGKWIFGWTVVGPRRGLTIPPAAWVEYRFQTGEEAILVRGSRTSGGFGLATPRLLAQGAALLQMRTIAQAVLDQEGQIVLPAAVGVRPGDRLLVVRGSGRALGFLARGPIYEEALRHPKLETFTAEQ